MMINKKLNLDTDTELLESGILCHASNIVINNSNNGILSENSIEQKISLEDNETIVGYIACSDEFVIFTSNSRIIRINSKDYSQKVIQTNWKWQGGKVIGCYTYNANQEMIVSISEQIDYEEEKVPLKIINLDNPNYKENDSDDKYTLTPEIPISNLINYEYINGTSIYKGVYCFFIRYKLGTDYTSWFKLGYPINIYNKNHKETIVEGKFGYISRTNVGDSSYEDTEKVGTYGFSESCDDDSVNITQNIRLSIEVTLRNIQYEKYQIGYIITDVENNTHVFTTIDYDITNKIVIIDNKNNDEISVDEITRDAFQIYNAKTLCNYGNRVYLANYNEENLNVEVPNIDVSGITVNAIGYASNKVKTNTIKSVTNNKSVSLLNTTTKVTKSTTTVNSPKYFTIGKGYYVELYFNFKDNTSNYPLNLKFFCTRLCSINDKNCIILKVADILHAAASYLNIDTYNTNITFSVSYNASLIKECKFIAIVPKNNSYNIEFIADNIEFYNNAYNEILNVSSVYSTGSTLDSTKPCIGQKTDTREGITSDLYNKADIEYYVPKTNNSTGDLFVTSITEFDTTVESLNTIEPGWFYNGIFKLNDIEYATHGSYTANNYYSNPWNTAYPIVDDEKNIIKYKARKAFNFNILNNTILITNKLLELFPNCTFNFLRYCIKEDNSEATAEIKIAINVTDITKPEISLAYDKINKKYYFVKIEWSNYYPVGVYILQNDFYVIDETTEETKHNISELFETIEYTDNRKNNTLNDLINYWSGGGDQGYVNTYEWSEDRQPTEEEWNINEQYNIEWGKLVYSSDGKEGDYDVINRIYGLQPIAVGYQNITENEETHVITVDKDFAIAISLYTLCNQLPINDGTLPIQGIISNFNETDTVVVCGKDKNDILKEGIFGNFYILFKKQDIINYGGQEVINGIVCYLREETPIDSAVPIFDKLYDFTFDLSSVNDKWEYPGFKNITNDTIYIPNALFYCTKFTQGEFDIDDADTNSEYQKTAISNAVYNFFIHFVYPNGNYTAGIRIPNNRTYSLNIPVANCTIKGEDGSDKEETFTYECGEDTTVGIIKSSFKSWVETNNATINSYDEEYCIYRFFDCQDSLRICNIYPVFDDNGIAVYINSKGEKLFRGFPKDKEKTPYPKYNYSINFRFDNIPQPEGFVGYFISYEKPEHILIGTGPIIPFEEDFNSTYNKNYNDLRFYYPEFNILKKVNGVNVIITREKLIGGTAKIGPMFTDFYDIIADKEYSLNNNLSLISGVDNIEIISPNDASNNNGGREGVLRIKLNENLKIASVNQQYTTHTNDEEGYAYLTQAVALAITDNIYLNDNKELISLGLIKYYNDEDTNNTYGYDNYPYNYDYYKTNGSVYSFNKRGVVFNEVDGIPKFFDDNTDIYPNYPIINTNIFDTSWRQGNSPICRYNYDLFCEIDLNAKQIDNAPIEHYYTLKKDDDDDVTDNDDIVNVRTVYVYPLYINDLFKIASFYNEFTDKIITNYNDELYYNFITYYGKTIRRSDIISDESIENRWRVFRAEEYKTIKENKGNIINIVGIGIYLMAHCEHSLFIFNRDNTMRTNDKNVQLVIPDAFEIDYSEVFTSDKGYAGLQEFNQWCVSNYGYIFFDKDSKKLYRYDTNTLDELTIGMINLFRVIKDIKFAIDTENQRLICIGLINRNIPYNKFTISYSFLTKNWISTHSYWYDDLFNTKDKVFFILNNNASSIHSFTEKFNSYSNIITDETNIFKTELIDNNPASFIDVVFNNGGVDKVLDYVTYRINKATDDTYSGDKMLIYTNICYSDYMDISKPRKNIKDYKNPVFRFGIWVYNWFRNKVLKIDSINPIIRGNGKFALNDEDLGKGVANALIIGKYFIIRIIFRDEDKRISIDDIQCY